MFLYIIPSQKSKASDENQCRYRQIHRHLHGIGRQRRERLPKSHQIETRITESGNRMKERLPQSQLDSLISAENRQENQRADQFDNQRRLKDKTGQANDASHLGRRDSRLHSTSLHESDFLS